MFPQNSDSKKLWQVLSRVHQHETSTIGAYQAWFPKVYKLLKSVGAKIDLENLSEKAKNDLLPLKGWNGKDYSWLDTIEKLNKEIDGNKTYLRQTGWDKLLHSFAFEDAAELATHSRFILAYDVGLSKTRTSLAVANLWDEATLVIVPVSLKEQWLKEISNLPMQVVCQVISYEDLWRSEFDFPAYQTVIADEGHLLRNPDALRTIYAKQLGAKNRIVLTATPSSGYVRDFQGILEFLNQGSNFLPYDFRERFGVSEANRELPVIKNASVLRNMLAPIMKVRTRNEPEVANIKSLAVDNETDLFVPFELDKEHLEFYLSQARAMWGWWLHAPPTEAQARLGVSRLIKATACPQTLDFGLEKTTLQEFVLDNAEDGTIIFCHHQAIAMWYSQKLKCPYLSSEIPSEKRYKIINNFRENGGLLVMTYGVGSKGHNIPEGKKIIFAEPYWGGDEMFIQAKGRLKRPGRTEPPVFIFPFYRGTILEHMINLSIAKTKSIQSIQTGIESQSRIPKFSELLYVAVQKAKRMSVDNV